MSLNIVSWEAESPPLRTTGLERRKITARTANWSREWKSLFVLFFFGPNVRHMEVPRLGVESELQLPAYTTATAMQDPSCVCDLHHSSRQGQVLNPLGEARDRTCVLTDASQIC